jgi:hypothetical protein
MQKWRKRKKKGIGKNCSKKDRYLMMAKEKNRNFAHKMKIYQEEK